MVHFAEIDFFVACYTARVPTSFMNVFLWNTLLELLEKPATQINRVNIPLAVCKRTLNIYEASYKHL